MNGDTIRSIRKSLNMSQADFAKVMGVSFTTIGRWETDKSPLSHEQAEQLETFNEVLTKGDIDKEKISSVLRVAGISGVLSLAAASGFVFTTALGASLGAVIGGPIGAVGLSMIGVGLKKLFNRS